MQKWEYQEIRVSYNHWSINDVRQDGTAPSHLSILNWLGQQGWELAAAERFPRLHFWNYWMIVKRPLP